MRRFRKPVWQKCYREFKSRPHRSVKRFKEHNSGLSQATKPFIPYKLIFYEAFLNQTDAKNREIYLKGGYGRKTIKAMLSKYFKNT